MVETTTSLNNPVGDDEILRKDEDIIKELQVIYKPIMELGCTFYSNRMNNRGLLRHQNCLCTERIEPICSECLSRRTIHPLHLTGDLSAVEFDSHRSIRIGTIRLLSTVTVSYSSSSVRHLLDPLPNSIALFRGNLKFGHGGRASRSLRVLKSTMRYKRL